MHVHINQSLGYACIYMYVMVYGLVGETEVTVVYIVRLVRNHDLAGVGQTPWSYVYIGIAIWFGIIMYVTL